MTTSLQEYLRVQVLTKSLLLIAGIWLLLQGTAIAQSSSTACSGSIPPNWPSPPLSKPNPLDSQEINDLVSRYGLALENKDGTSLGDILDANVTYEVCNAGGGPQNVLKNNRNEVLAYYNNLWPALTIQNLTAQHLSSNLILNSTGPDSVEGRFTQVVFLQTSFGPPQPDYTGTVRATFTKQSGVWRFQSFLLISTIPNLGGGIGTQAR